MCSQGAKQYISKNQTLEKDHMTFYEYEIVVKYFNVLTQKETSLKVVSV